MLAAGLRAGGVEVVHDALLRHRAGPGARPGGRGRGGRRASAGVNLRLVDADHVGIACDETTTARTPGRGLGGVRRDGPTWTADAASRDSLPAPARESDFLTHPVFTSHHSETAMLRYLRRLSDKDYALDRGMIPLGSCTMKLNATTEMEPITLARVRRTCTRSRRPSRPPGYLELIGELERWLAEITGYDAVSLQPNAGSQGELAGLLAIRALPRGRGDGHRDVCLIPSSAHGTNAASAVMAGMRVVVVACDDDGNVDLADLRRQDRRARGPARRDHGHLPVHARGLRGPASPTCARWSTTPAARSTSTAPTSTRWSGFAKPGRFGADVSPPEPAQDVLHPARRRRPRRRPGRGARAPGAVPAQPPAAPRPARTAGPVIGGAAGARPAILPISWAYIRLMGADGLRAATAARVLAANYVAARLATTTRCSTPARRAWSRTSASSTCGRSPRQTGVTVDDVAKRLIDYGFHAPTMSFPVAGTLMVEPTE